MYAAVSAAYMNYQRSVPCHTVGRAYQVIELDSGDALIDTRDNLLGDGSGVDVFGVQAIAQTGNACRNLVELYSLFTIV